MARTLRRLSLWDPVLLIRLISDVVLSVLEDEWWASSLQQWSLHDFLQSTRDNAFVHNPCGFIYLTVLDANFSSTPIEDIEPRTSLRALINANASKCISPRHRLTCSTPYLSYSRLFTHLTTRRSSDFSTIGNRSFNAFGSRNCAGTSSPLIASF